MRRRLVGRSGSRWNRTALPKPWPVRNDECSARRGRKFRNTCASRPTGRDAQVLFVRHVCQLEGASPLSNLMEVKD